jgi:ATP-dependent Lon protease
VPRRNEPDLDDVPESVRAEIYIRPVSTVAEVLSLALSLDVASGERLLQAA